MSLHHLIISAFLTTLALTTAHAGKLTPAQLAEVLKRPGPKPVLIDIRPTVEFREGSIPGAINIPGRVLLAKKMRFANGCVLISDGIADKVAPAELATKLAEKGVTPVDYLQGGMAAWTELKEAATTHRVGAREGRGSRTITYQDLVKREGDTCLVDVRPVAERRLPRGHQCPVRGLCSKKNFVYYPSLKAFHAAQAARRDPAEGGQPTPLILLIGGKDTSLAEDELEKLFIEGFHRSAVLLGGAGIIARQGRRGVKRRGGRTIEVPADRRPRAPSLNRKPRSTPDSP